MVWALLIRGSTVGVRERQRRIVVRTQRQQRLDDAEVQERLRSSFADARPSLTQPGIALVHGPRGLVRALYSSSKDVRRAGRTARALVRRLQDPLAACYEDAFTRRPVDALQLRARLTIDADRVAQASVLRGALIDDVGDRCLTEALTDQMWADGATPDRGSGEVEVQLLFFYESAVFIVEATGEYIRPGQVPTRAPPVDPVKLHKFAPWPEF